MGGVVAGGHEAQSALRRVLRRARREPRPDAQVSSRRPLLRGSPAAYAAARRRAGSARAGPDAARRRGRGEEVARRGVRGRSVQRAGQELARRARRARRLRRIETAHFVLRFDPVRDSLKLARYASRWLEDEVYPEITERLAYAPREKSLIEIFSSAKGGSGHQWVQHAHGSACRSSAPSARARARWWRSPSPNDGRTRFNWARVLASTSSSTSSTCSRPTSTSRTGTPRGWRCGTRGRGGRRAGTACWRSEAAADSLFDLDTDRPRLRPAEQRRRLDAGLLPGGAVRALHGRHLRSRRAESD